MPCAHSISPFSLSPPAGSGVCLCEKGVWLRSTVRFYLEFRSPRGCALFLLFSDAPVSCLMRALVPMWFRHASLAPLRPALCAAPSAHPLAVAIAPLIDSDAVSALLPPARFIKLAVFCATSAGSAVDSALVNLPVQKSFDSFLALAVQHANVAVEQVCACLLSNSPCVLRRRSICRHAVSYLVPYKYMPFAPVDAAHRLYPFACNLVPSCLISTLSPTARSC